MATVGLVLFAFGPGAATAAASAANTAGNDSLDVSVSQAGNSGPTVTVTDNDTAVENASVSVEALENGTYEGTDETYSTDANGTVSLPAPEETVTVNVTATAGDATGSTTVELTAGNETASFGDRVSAFVKSLLSEDADNVGQQVAEFVTENNPGNAPDHAGPPADDDERGPPEDRGNDADDDKRGPPEDRGNNADDDESDEDKRRGPPENAGPPEDRGNDADDDETEAEDDSEADEEDDAEDDSEADEEDDAEDESEADDDDESEDDSADDTRGPPANANAGGN